MAVTRMKPSRRELGSSLRYAMDPEKTGNGWYVSGISCVPGLAALQFMQTKEFWSMNSGTDKTVGVICYVGYMSFEEGEVDAETAHRIGVELAERMWGGRYEAVIATHLNTPHIHNHFVVNSVSWKDGDKVAVHQTVNYNMWREANRICLEFGLSVLEKHCGNNRPINEYWAEKEGKPTLRNIIRSDIDRAVRGALTFSEFTEDLRRRGYSLILTEDRRKGYPGLMPPGGERYYSFRKLGLNYGPDRIKERILENTRRVKKERNEIEAEVTEYRANTEPVADIDDLPGKWKKFGYELELIVKIPESVQEIPVSIRQDIIRSERIRKYIELMESNDIRSEETLSGFVDDKEKELELLIETRRHNINEQNLANYHKDEKLKKTAAENIHENTRQIRALRAVIRTAKEAEEKSSELVGKLDLIKSLHERAMGKEEREDEQLVVGGSGSGREDSAAGDRDRG